MAKKEKFNHKDRNDQFLLILTSSDALSSSLKLQTFQGIMKLKDAWTQTAKWVGGWWGHAGIPVPQSGFKSTCCEVKSFSSAHHQLMEPAWRDFLLFVHTLLMGKCVFLYVVSFLLNNWFRRDLDPYSKWTWQHLPRCAQHCVTVKGGYCGSHNRRTWAG